MLLEVLSIQRTAPGATLGAGTFQGGDSGTIRSFRDPYKAYLVGMWSHRQVAGAFRIRSPRLHDNVDGITQIVPLTTTRAPQNMLNDYQKQEVKSQDTLLFESSGSGVGGNIESDSALFFYQQVDGTAARLIDEPTLDKIADDIMVCNASIVAGVGGGYTTPTALSAFTVGAGNWQANRDYALIGYFVDSNVCTVGIRGVDSGNVRIGMPGNVSLGDYTSNFFVAMSRAQGLPTIPVFNAANKPGIIVDVLNNQVANTINVSFVFQLLTTIVAMQS